MYRIYDEKNDFITKVINSYNLNEKQKEEILDNDLKLPVCEDPELMMIADRIMEAKENNEKIFVAGDYDTDGVMATTILKDTFDNLGIENGYYIPNRFEEGYGLTAKTCKLVYEKGYDLIITVDNGVKSLEAIDYCNSVGLEIIVTDHHKMDDDIDVVNILHPQLLDEYYHGMCGAGMAYLISETINHNDYHTVLAMIATIGDMMNLFGYNRKLVRKGLQILNEKKYSNIMILLDKKSEINETDIAFQLVPKINAVGRLANMSNPNNLIKYFVSKDAKLIDSFSKQIVNINNIRKAKSKAMVEKAKTLVTDDSINLIYDESFEEGMCGLAAGSLANTYKKATIVLTKKEDKYVGSARSVIGFDLYEYLNKVSYLFEKFGGHKMAAGLSINEENLLKFKNYLENNQVDYQDVSSQTIRCPLNDLTISNVKQLDVLRPFGQGFLNPLFYVCDYKVINYTKVKGIYPKWSLKSDVNVSAISFNNGLDKPNPVTIIATAQINNYMNKETVSLIVKDIE
jgi:single-stranded-DNA-specific exonuclease